MRLDLYGGQYGIFNKTEAAQYLRPLLTNRDQNFTKSTLFGHTFPEFDNWQDTWPPWRPILSTGTFLPNCHQIVIDLCKGTYLVKFLSWLVRRGLRYWASTEVQVPNSLKTCKVCLKSTHLVKFWCGSVKQVLRYWAASVLSHIPYWPPQRSKCRIHSKPVKCV